MSTGKKFRIRPRSLKNRVKESFGRFVDYNHSIGLDPLDHTLFTGKYGTSMDLKQK